MNPHFIERETVLATCPSSRCRRNGACERAGTREPCRRTHEPVDAVRDRMSRRFAKLAAEAQARGEKPVSGLELERRLGFLKRMLEEREAEDFAKERAAAKR